MSDFQKSGHASSEMTCTVLQKLMPVGYDLPVQIDFLPLQDVCCLWLFPACPLLADENWTLQITEDAADGKLQYPWLREPRRSHCHVALVQLETSWPLTLPLCILPFQNHLKREAERFQIKVLSSIWIYMCCIERAALCCLLESWLKSLCKIKYIKKISGDTLD